MPQDRGKDQPFTPREPTPLQHSSLPTLKLHPFRALLALGIAGVLSGCNTPSQTPIPPDKAVKINLEKEPDLNLTRAHLTVDPSYCKNPNAASTAGLVVKTSQDKRTQLGAGFFVDCKSSPAITPEVILTASTSAGILSRSIPLTLPVNSGEMVDLSFEKNPSGEGWRVSMRNTITGEGQVKFYKLGNRDLPLTTILTQNPQKPV